MISPSMFESPEASVPDEYRPELEAQRRRDMIARQRSTLLFNPGIFALVVAGVLITSPTIEEDLLLGGTGLLLGGSIYYRLYALRLFSQSVVAPSSADWIHLHLSLASSALIWGMVLVLALLPTPMHDHYALVYAAVTGLAAGGIVTLSLKPSMVVVYVFGIMGPGILLSLTGYSIAHPGLAALMLVFSLGMCWVAAGARAEYVKSVLNNLILQEQSEKLTHLTTLDWLTNVNNRSHFDQITGSELLRARRIGYPITLLMVDVDHFKSINDTYGHLVGDDCLASIAAEIKECLKRETDIVARYGGEEFAVLLSGVDEDEGAEMAEAIRKRVASLSLSHYNNSFTVSVSIGGATTYSDDNTTRDEIVSRADAALYRAKAEGRNQVCWSPAGR